ncbi:MAG TPA: PHB depolymerase family esterase [Microvirga sp.]|nr:PHB depolymerase family esterase [Microvirga sp.]
MRGLGSTTARLARYRKTWETMAAATAQGAGGAAHAPNHLDEVTGFGSNPGALRLFLHVPERPAPRPALVVVLHGCTQDAASYDRGAGWSQLADRHGFIALFPEQPAANNPRTCFNWFQPGDTARGRGEALSIRQMVEHVAVAHGVDRARIFVTGLSAGGAMTAVMLAAYPDVFAGGAIVAGLPYGVAHNVQEALDAMFQGGTRPAAEWGDRVRAASRHRGPWPKVSVWHGGADATVKPVNADEIVKQWTNVHGLPEKPSLEESVDGYPRRVWHGPGGEALVESYTITGMAHGTPLGLGAAEAVGAAGPFLLDVGISSTQRIAAFWGLTAEIAAGAPTRDARPQPVVDTPARDARAEPSRARPAGAPSTPPRIRVLEGEVLPPEGQGRGDRTATPDEETAPRGALDPGRVITEALKAAGLMRR